MLKRLVLACAALTLLASCSHKGSSDKPEPEPVPVQWTKTTIRPGLTWYSYRGYETVSRANQVINVLELDFELSGLKLEFQYYPAKTTLTTACSQTEGAVAGTNASFGTPHTFIRTGGTTWCDLSGTNSDDVNWYKHEAAICFDGVSQFGFINYEGDPVGAIDTYRALTWPNVFSSRPLMIEDSKDVIWASRLKSFNSVLAPRTAVALTAEGTVLFVTVDGRWYGMANGITIADLRDFLRLNFNPTYAIAMDGGGSTTMFIKGYGKDGIVNYPCNSNGASSEEYAEYEGTFTERSLPTFFIIKE